MCDLIGQIVRLPEQIEGKILAQDGATLYVLLEDGNVKTSPLEKVQFCHPETLFLEAHKRWMDIEEAAHHLDISRRTLDRWLADAPTDLPGAPIPAGVGKSKNSWRFDPDTIDQWARAFASWRRKHRISRNTANSGKRRSPTKRKGRTSIFKQTHT